ncbi:MAG: hypothetical protein ACLU9S_17240 [Oscillospiraceae bacterium]
MGRFNRAMTLAMVNGFSGFSDAQQVSSFLETEPPSPWTQFLNGLGLIVPVGA